LGAVLKIDGFLMQFQSLNAGLREPYIQSANSTPKSHMSTSVDYSANTPNWGIGLEPLWLVLGGLGAKLDYNLTNETSIGMSGIYIPERDNTTSEENKSTTVAKYRWTYYEINIGPTFMLTGKLNTNGFYIYPAIGVAHAEIFNYDGLGIGGEVTTPQIRTTAGYQWAKNDFRLVAGAAFRIFNKDSDIIIRNSAGQELGRQDLSSTGGFALDLQIGLMF
jgi:hypothetical protein